MKAVDVSSIPYEVYAHPREGTVELKILVASDAGDGMNFTLALVRYGEGDDTFHTPRHRHTFEQIRYSVSGSQNYAKGKDIPEGWVGYFPEGAYYGPQHVDGGVLLLLQFGFGYLSEEQKKVGQEKLKDRGEFKNGIFTYTNPTTGKRENKDAVEALWEEIHGRPLVYPQPRYPETILMNPKAFAWTTRSDVPGLEFKRLGSFTERDVRIGMIKWQPSASLPLPSERAHLVFSLSGGIEIDGQSFEDQAAVFSEKGEETSVGAVAETKALVIGMPLTS